MTEANEINEKLDGEGDPNFCYPSIWSTVTVAVPTMMDNLSFTVDQVKTGKK